MDNTKDKSTKQNRPKKISQKELKFCNEYIKTGNGSDAVRKAGYKAHNDPVASAIATRLLKKPLVAEKIGQLRASAEKSSIASAAEVMDYFTKVMRGEIKDQFGLDAPLSERTKAAQELAKRTVDIDNRIAGKPDAEVHIKVDWQR